MKITIVHGSQRKGNTERTIELIKSKLNSFESNEFFDFYLPKDLPMFCLGCFQCLDKGSFGGEHCPHAKYTHPIIEAIKNSDGIVIASPVYSLAESGQVKAFFDHFGCIFMNHRPIEEMFSKTAYVISTTAGAGTRHTIKTIERSLTFWGIPKVIKCGITLWVKNWSELTINKQSKFEKQIKDKTDKFYKSMKRKNVHVPMKTRILFGMFRRLMNSYSDGHQDKEYWRNKGWLNGDNPW